MKVQALVRGKLARKQLSLEKKRAEESESKVVKIQAFFRGNQQRKKVKKLKEERDDKRRRVEEEK